MRTRFARKSGGPGGVSWGTQQEVCGRALASAASLQRREDEGARSNSREDRARRAYESNDFASALELYQAAIRAANPKSRVEISALLSNAAACRLQLLKSSPGAAANVDSEDGEGRSNGYDQAPTMIDEEVNSERLAHARAAVEEARRCVRLNPTWSRGYLRLAEALLASKGRSNDFSNEACNCLQTALRLDPNLTQARWLLQQELSRDHERPVRRRVRFASSPERSATDRTEEEDVVQTDSASAAAGEAANTYELHDATSSSRSDRFRSTWIRARRKATSWFWRHSDRLCQLGMLLALVLFLGELVLLLDELAVQTPAFRGRAGSRPSGIAKRLGPINVVRQYRLASTTFQGNYWPSHIYQHYQQALTFDKYRDAYEQFRKRGQLRRPVEHRPQNPPRAAYLYADPDLPLPSSRSALPLVRVTSSEAKFGLACWLLLLPLVLGSMVRMRRHVVESVTVPAQHAREIARYYGAVLGRRGRSGPLRAVPIEQ
jgi:tetratricopeptide (TPR) repeat protein